MSTGAGILLAAISATGRIPGQLWNVIFWLIAYALAVYSVFGAWRKEYRLRLAAEQERDETKRILTEERAALGPVRCPRCKREVPPWFFDKKRPMSQMSTLLLMKKFMDEEGISLPEAEIKARGTSPEDKYGCYSCGGRAHGFPLPTETKEEFEARTKPLM